MRHNMISTKSQHPDTSIISKNEWNADHVGDFLSSYSGTNKISIPGIAGSKRLKLRSPNSYDDEFEGNLNNWSTLGSLDTLEITDTYLHIARTSTGTMQLNGIYKQAPPMPFTVSVYIRDMLLGSNYQNVGIMLLGHTNGIIFQSGKMYWTSGQDNSGYGIWANNTTRTTFIDNNLGTVYKAPYRQMVVTSPSNVTLKVSRNGHVWRTTQSAINTTLTYIWYVGIFVTSHDGVGVTTEGLVDWIRFT